MRLYTYKCTKCNVTFDKEYAYGELPEPFTFCPSCNEKCYRYWGNSSIVIPEHFRATSTLYNNNTPSDYHYMKERLKHGVRPSGKEKVYF